MRRKRRAHQLQPRVDLPAIDYLGAWPQKWQGPWPPLPPELPAPTREDNHTAAAARMKAARALPKLFDANTMVLPEARAHYSQLWQAEARALEAAAAAEHKPRKARRRRT